MSDVIWSPAAEQDLEELAEYLSEVARRPQIAVELLEEIRTKCESYARQPGMGARHPQVPDPCRIFLHSRYVVVYEPADEGISVVRVFHSARDWTRVFSGDES